MVTDWRPDEKGVWHFNNGPGRVIKTTDGKFEPVYDGIEYGLWADVQNAMYVVELAHREKTLAVEIAAVDGLGQ